MLGAWLPHAFFALGGALLVAPPRPAEPNPAPEAYPPASKSEVLDPDELFVTEVAMGSSIGIGVLDPSGPSRAWRDNDFPGYGPLMWTPFAVDGEL